MDNPQLTDYKNDVVIILTALMTIAIANEYPLVDFYNHWAELSQILADTLAVLGLDLSGRREYIGDPDQATLALVRHELDRARSLAVQEEDGGNTYWQRRVLFMVEACCALVTAISLATEERD